MSLVGERSDQRGGWRAASFRVLGEPFATEDLSNAIVQHEGAVGINRMWHARPLELAHDQPIAELRPDLGEPFGCDARKERQRTQPLAHGLRHPFEKYRGHVRAQL